MKKQLSKPRRFYELRLKLKFGSDAARDRLIDQILESSYDGGIDLGALMIGLDKDAKVQFPKQSSIPVLFKDIESVQMVEMDTLVGNAKISLEVTTDDAMWAMNYETQEPERLHDQHLHPPINNLPL